VRCSQCPPHRRARSELTSRPVRGAGSLQYRSEVDSDGDGVAGALAGAHGASPMCRSGVAHVQQARVGGQRAHGRCTGTGDIEAALQWDIPGGMIDDCYRHRLRSWHCASLHAAWSSPSASCRRLCSSDGSASGHTTGGTSACEAANARANGPPRFTTVVLKLTAKMASLIAQACTPAQLTSDASMVLHLPLATHRTEIAGLVSRIEAEICPANPGSKLCSLP
jgi:hypothetical protein